MVKPEQNARNLRSRVEISRGYPKRRPREKGKVDAIGATTGAASLIPNQLKSLKKCVVKLRRISNLESATKSRVNNLNDTSNFGETTFHADLVRNSTMIFESNEKNPITSKNDKTITPCRVRVKRISSKRNTPVAINNPAAGVHEEHRFFHRDQPPTRSRSSVTRNVYEFLSQSQIEDADERSDPAEDIIKKMVNDGRACMMTRTRIPGQFRAKPVRRKVRPVGKRRQCSLDEVPVTAPTSLNKAMTPIFELNAKSSYINKTSPVATNRKEMHRAMSPIYELDDDSSYKSKTSPVVTNRNESQPLMSPIYELDTGLSDESEPNNMETIHVEAQTHHFGMESPAVARSLMSVHEPAYSDLARSVLLHQTQNQSLLPSKTKRREMLDIVRQYISTPINSKSGKTVTTTISPIPSHTRRVSSSPASSTPWRVSPESSLPDTFRFGFNTSNLPSFSSEHPRTRHIYVPDENHQPTPSDSICPTMDDHTNLASEIENNSNGENMPPPANAGTENMENLVHLPNPRRTLQNRAPLKDINIIEVVHLPPWKKHPLLNTTPSNDLHTTKENSSLLTQSLVGTNQLPSCRRSPSSSRGESCNLFGFEEFIDHNEQFQNEAQARSLGQNQTLNDKLQRVKRLRPIEKRLPKVAPPIPMRYVYEDLEASQPRQRSIRQMLCSTMIGQERQHFAQDVDESVGLFSDYQPDPEVSFDHKKPRRTYVRERPKRKRKQRVKILFIDTDSSDNEQDSLEESTSPNKAPSKRPRKDLEHEAKLNEFVTTFNKQCKEVEKFPVVIE